MMDSSTVPNDKPHVGAVPDSNLTDSENTNNENREIELRQSEQQSSDAEFQAAPSVENMDSTDAAAEAAEAAESDDRSSTGEDSSQAVEHVETTASSSASDSSSSADYAKHITYNTGGIAIYTDPSSGEQFEFDAQQNQWIAASAENRLTAPPEQSSGDNPYEDEFYRWCHETQQWIPKTAVTTSPTAAAEDAGDGKETNDAADAASTETEFYKYDAGKREWIPKASGRVVTSTRKETHGDDGDGVAEWEHTYEDDDGMVFLWDGEKRAWFPKIDDMFMAQYQMGYGNYEASDEEEREEEELNILERMLEERLHGKKDGDAVGAEGDAVGEEPEQQDKAKGKRKAPQEPPKWFDLAEEKNTKVYVSNLPTDITEAEFVELMSKYGMIFRDPGSDKMKVKLYTDANGQLKGDGLCDYIRRESVDMALRLLDGLELRGRKIRVEMAKFQMRGEYNPALKPKKRKKDKEKLRKMQEKLLDWRPEKMRGERSKHERYVIIKNLFEPEMIEKEVELLLEYQGTLREECGKCGTVRKVVVFDKHPEGIAQVLMSDVEEADVVVQMMHKRFFGSRQLTAELWDGVTKYKIDESAADESQRLSNWEQFLTEDNAAAEADRATPPLNDPQP